MKTIFFTPGPSKLYPTVKKHLKDAINKNIPSLSHRSSAFQEIYREASRSLRRLLRVPKDYRIFFLSSATEAMERIVENCVVKNSFHLSDGAFSDSFYQIAVSLGKKAEVYRVADGSYLDCLSITVPAEAEMICLTHNETSTGVSLPLTCISHARKLYPDKLIALDIVSSVPYPALDIRLVDCLFFSVQKGFGLPSGLGVLIVGPRAIEKSLLLKKKHISTGSYHRFERLVQYDGKSQTPETPNVLGIYLLGKVTQDFLTRGIGKIRQDIREKADVLYSFFAKTPGFVPFADKRLRSDTVIVIEVTGGSDKLLDHLKEKGFVVGRGYGKHKKEHIRIANFPAHTKGDVQRLLKEIKRFKF